MRASRFHGRHEDTGRECEHPTCREPGEFRAPGDRGNSFDGPGEWRWLCLEHVREFNAGYDWFEGMDADEIFAAQRPYAGWESESTIYKAATGRDGMPRWADFKDPLDAIGQRAAGVKSRAREWQGRRKDGVDVSPEERRALDTLGLPLDTNRPAIRRRYSQLVRRYHPDRNGGDRRHERRLQAVVEAYQTLKTASAFA